MNRWKKVGPAAEITLYGAGGDADHRRAQRQDQPEQHRDAEAVDHPRQNVARLVVGAQPVPVAERAVHIRAAPCVARSGSPYRTSRTAAGAASGISIVGAIGIADRRPDQPAIGLDLILITGSR
jgi:hypothetical protein